MSNAPPEMTYRIGNVYAKVWLNETSDGKRQFRAVTLERHYQDDAGGNPAAASPSVTCRPLTLRSSWPAITLLPTKQQRPPPMSDDAHDLMPDSIAERIPPLYATQHDNDPLVRLKWFTPDSSWTWYVTEYDPAERLCFGLVIGHEREFGYFSLDEIESVRGQMGLPVERDLHFHPMRTSECR